MGKCYLCRHPSCNERITTPGYCAKHAPLHQSKEPFTTAAKPNEHWYKTYRWHQLSKKIREENPVCVDCGSDRNLQVHHLIEGALNEEDFFDESMLIVLCRRCHQIRTQRHTVELKKRYRE